MSPRSVRSIAALTTLGLAPSRGQALPAPPRPAARPRISTCFCCCPSTACTRRTWPGTWPITPGSALAMLVGGGVEFTKARTPFPSDSFPGMVGQVTGGNPSSTGVYYDDTWNHALLPAGTTSCAGVTPGVEVTYFEALDNNVSSIDAGQGLAGLPGSILQMTGNPASLINPANLPVDPTTCKPVYPHSYLKVNTIFEVARRPAHRLVGQAPGLRDPQRAVRDRRSGPLHPGDQQQRADARVDQRLDDRQRPDHAVRLVQGPGGHQRDQGLRPQRHRAGWGRRPSSA